jgi:hypothetical protein
MVKIAKRAVELVMEERHSKPVAEFATQAGANGAPDYSGTLVHAARAPQQKAV